MVRMTVEAKGAKSGESVPAKWAGEMRYVARQPILNAEGRVRGYELLFRSDPLVVSAGNGDMAARTMLDNAVLFGLERFTNGLPAFIRCSVEALTEQLVDVLVPRETVLGVPASLADTPKLVDACRALKARGFRLALDDFCWNGNLEPLVRLADYIRVEFNRFGATEIEHLRRLKCDSIARVAQKVETQEDYQLAVARGFRLFQGSYICHPVLMKQRKVPANRILHFEIVRELHHDPIEVRRLGQLVMRDASLTFRLLRLVNSPLYAIRQELRSIESAMLMIGDDTLRRVISLAVLSEMNSGQPPEILHMALVRARFCELAACPCGLDPNEQYLLGMFSLLPAMLGAPMEELTPSLPLRAVVCAALEGTANRERILLAWVEGHERGDWQACDRIADGGGLRREELAARYTASVVWAGEALHSSE
jgi:EAL and modified HD-GYP domain-containing signal transduction protein